MEKGEKASPSPKTPNLFDAASLLGIKTPTSSTPNIFDAATLLGASPFAAGLSALPFGHLAHLPGAFSMLGHPGFPVTSLFGQLGDGLQHPLVSPSSLSNSLSSSAAKHGFSSPSFSKSQSSPPSKSSSSKTSSVSPPAKPGPSTSTQKSPRSPPGSRHRNSGGRGRPRKLTKQPPIPLSLVSGTGILSPSQLEKYMKKNDTSVTNGYDDGSFHQKSPNSLLSQNGHHGRDKKQPGSRGRVGARGHRTSNTAGSLNQDKVHIDSMKKKLIADQIRQRMQSKTSPPGSGKKRGRGRPPKISNDSSPPNELNDDQKKLQEDLKQQLEAELKQQQMALRMLKNASGSPTQTDSIIKSNTSPKETANFKVNTSPKDKHDVHNKMNSSRKELGSQLFERVNVNMRSEEVRGDPRKAGNVHEEMEGDPTQAGNSTNSKRTTERESSAGKSDGKSSTVKHVGLLNLVRQRSPEGKSQQSSSKKEELQKEEPLFANFKKKVDGGNNVSSAGDSDDSSGSGSSSDSSSSSSDSSDEENSESKSESGSVSSKRRASECSEGAEIEGTERVIKRRKVVLDETHLQIPLNHGWKRQTHINNYGRRGIQGEVCYFAPCGRKMKTIPDVMRYLERTSVTEFGRDHFSFSTKVNVGEFYENRSGGENGYVKLSDAEVTERLAVTLSRRQKFMENKKKQEKINLQQTMAKKMMEAKMKQKLQHQEMARKVAEMQFKQRLEKQQQKDLLKRAKQLKVFEKRKEKEQEKLLREKERLQREEQLRMKREYRTQQILEKQMAKAKAKEEKQHMKALKQAESSLLWYKLDHEQELKRQQTAMLKEQMRLKQEQERQRQHILLLKALEQRKKLEISRIKAEEKERQREEEKRSSKEKKWEQRRLEFVLAQELKIPREDMELRDFKPMPDYPKIEGCVLDGDAFADCLMTLEFLHNFASALGFDKDTLPTMKGLQDAVTSKTEDDAEEYLSLVSHLLKYALDDPGVPNPKEAVTRLGQKIVDIEVTDAILPEVIRVFMEARNGKQTELSEHLLTHPLEACSASQRASVLAFLCNELNCSKNITTEIERNLDHMGDIRRDKWIVEGKLRRLRVLQARKFHRPAPKPVGDGDNSIVDGEDSMTSTTMTSKHNSDDDEGSGNESDGATSKDDSFNDNEEDDPTTLEDLEKQMEKLQKQHAQYRDKVFDASHKVRAIILGQDRYKRTYWVLPTAGGIYIEGMESGEMTFDEEGKIISSDNKSSVKVKIEPVGDDKSKVVDENEMDVKGPKTEVKKENGSMNGADHKNSEKNMSTLNVNRLSDQREKIKGHPESMESENVVNNNQRENENTTSDKNKTADNVQNESCEGEKHKSIPNGDLDEKQESSSREATLCDKNPPQSVSVSGTGTTTKCTSKNVELKIPSIKPCAISSHDNMNLFLQVPSSTKLSDLCNISSNTDSKTVNNSNLIYTSSSPSYISTTHMAGGHVMSSANQITASHQSPLKPPPAHSHKNLSESKQSFMSIDSILKKEQPETSHTNQFFPLGLSPLTNTLLKDSPMSDGKPWFSILPRVPCDDMSLTRGQHSAGMMTSSPYLQHIPNIRSLSVPSPTFTSFQMGQILSHSSSFSSLPGTPSSSGMSTPVPVNDTFKVPDIPNRSCQTPDPEDVLKNLQGEERPIPEEFQSGWWKISEVEQLRQLQKCLHPRGIREKNLQKTIQKFSEYTTLSCTKGKKEVISLESSDGESESEEETEEGQENEEDTKEENTKDESIMDAENEEDTSSTKETSDSTKEESSATPSKTSSPKKVEKGKGRGNKGDNKEEKTVKRRKKKRVIPVIDCKQKSHESDMMALEEVQTMEDRIASASLQIKGWKLAPKIDSEDSTVKIIPRWETKAADNEYYPLEIAKERLLQLESNVERRYLKPPLCKAQKINLNSVSTYDEDQPEGRETVLPAGLQTWRMAVSTATSPAQIMLCIIQLNNSISWEKSIMKVLCQICRKDDNEAQLLLCDGCDRGYHTYCFKPKMETVPEGDWYCYECVSKAVGESCCLVCGRRFGKMAECHACPRAVHLDCLDPPLPRIPRKWFCASCEDEKGIKVKRPRKNSTASTASNSTTTSLSPRKNPTPASTPAPSPAPVVNPDSSSRSRTCVSAPPIHENSNLTPTGRKKRCDAGIPRKKKNPEATESPEKKEERSVVKPRVPLLGEESTDMVMCRLILMEMEKHDDGWPFLQPVNCKQFTSYRKFIKTPMDFSTMKQKLRDESYTTRGDFAADAFLVFENCKTFNEDDSEVGQCGHSMRRFFKRRWKELLVSSTDDDTDEASPS